MDEPEILFERRGKLGLVTLNRPKQLNALSYGMVKALHPQLEAWANDPSITAVAIRGAGEKAFCAGGDIRALYEFRGQGRVEDARTFWREEYILNRFIKRYPKPYIALIDGIVMGGGVGLAMHGSHRVAGPKFLFAMPEVGIGFFPDVGATYLLPRLPDHAGTYLAVTGARIGRPDGLALGLATHSIASGDFTAAIDAFADGEPVDQVLARLAEAPGPAPIAANTRVIAKTFDAASVAAILENLDKAASGGSEFAADTAKAMRTKSPTSMAIALEQVSRGATLDFEDAMTLEYRIVSRIALAHDFYEGVRAVIVDKDYKPAWQPARVEDVKPETIAGYFAPLPDDLAFQAIG